MKEMLQTFCFQELQDGPGMDSARSAWKLFQKGLSPFFVDELVSHLRYISCTATTLSCQFQNIEVESNDNSHLESFDALGSRRRILKKKKKKKKKTCTRSLTAKSTLTFARSLGFSTSPSGPGKR